MRDVRCALVAGRPGTAAVLVLDADPVLLHAVGHWMRVSIATCFAAGGNAAPKSGQNHGSDTGSTA